MVPPLNTISNMRRLVLLLFMGSIWSQLLAQDIHYAQFYNSPLLVSPAFSGHFKGNFRAILNLRHQWSSVGELYTTTSFSLDTRSFDNNLEANALGFGLVLLTDKSGPADLTYTKVAGSVSYSKFIGVDSKHMVAVGVQGGYYQWDIDETKLRFESQFSDLDFDDDKQSGEDLTNMSIAKPDFQAGFIYQYSPHKRLSIYGGLTFFHLTRPNESILNEFDKVSLRSMYQSGGEFMLTRKLSVDPAILIMRQNKAFELNFGGKVSYRYGYKMKHIKLGWGAWYRAIDAVVLMTQINYRKYQLGLSYDINFSKLTPASRFRGGPEISIIYIDLFGRHHVDPILPCTRF